MDTVKIRTDKFDKLHKGSVLSETQYYVVDEVKGRKTRLLTDNGEAVVVDSEYVNRCLTLADDVAEEKTVTRTELTQLFLSHPYTAMTVNYNKKVDPKSVLKQLMDTHQNTAPKDVEKSFKKTLTAALEGEERTAQGRHNASVDEFGRVSFIDMGKTRGDNPEHDGRLIKVDPRTLNWAIIKGVRYSAK